MNASFWHSDWAVFGGLLAAEVALIGAVVWLIQARMKTAAARSVVWQSALLAVFAVAIGELAGAGPALVRGLRSEAVVEASPVPQSEPEFARPLASEGMTFVEGGNSLIREMVEQRLAEKKAGLISSPEIEAPPTAAPTPPAPAGFPIEWAWGIGTLALLGLYALRRGGFLLCALRFEETNCPTLLARIKAMSERLGMRSAARAMTSPRLATPIAFGLFRPTVGLPDDFESANTDARKDAMLAHELAHLRARDPWWHLGADLMVAVFWWHPVAWWIAAQLKHTSESAADEACACVENGPEALAECLVDFGKQFADNPPANAIGMAGDGYRSRLGNRVEALLRMPADKRIARGTKFDSLRRFGTAAGLACAGLLLAACCAPDSAGDAEAPLTKAQAALKPPIEAAAAHEDKPDASNAAKAEVFRLIEDGKRLFELELYDDARNALRKAVELDPNAKPAYYYLSLILEKEAEAVRTRNSGLPLKKADLTAANSINQSITASDGRPPTKVFKLDPRLVLEEMKRRFPTAESPAPESPGNEVGDKPSSPTMTNSAAHRISMALNVLLTSNGVSLKPPNQMFYNDRNGVLMLRATPKELKAAQSAVEHLKAAAGEVVSLTGRKAPEYRGDNAAVAELIQDGKMLYEMQLMDEAEKKLRKAIELDPNAKAAYYWLARVQEATYGRGGRWGRWENAKEASLAEVERAWNNGQPLKSTTLPKDGLVTRVFKVDPETFLEKLRTLKPAPALDDSGASPVANQRPASGTNEVSEIAKEIRRLLTAAGVSMNPPPHVFYKDRDGRLMVRGSPQDVEGIASLVERLDPEPSKGETASSSNNLPEQRFRTNSVNNTSARRQAILRKLNTLRIAELGFEEKPLSEVIRFLGEEVRRLDPEKKGINFIVNPGVYNAKESERGKPSNVPSGPPLLDAFGRPYRAPGASPIDLERVSVNINPPIRDIVVIDALDAIEKTADEPIRFIVEEFGVVVVPRTIQSPLITRVFKVDPRTFIEGLRTVLGADVDSISKGGNQAGLPNQIGIPNQVGIGGQLPATRTNAASKVAVMVRHFFKSAGVEMKPPKQVFFNDHNGVLMVRATAQDMTIVEAAVEILSQAPPMVTIEAKWVEITVDPNDPDAVAALQKRVAEIMPHLDLSRVAGSLPGQNLPLVNPFTTDLIDQGVITNASTGDHLSGVLSPEQFHAAIRSFEMADGVDVLTAPRVTTLSARQAQVAVIDLATIPKGPVDGTNVISVPLGPTLDVLPYVDSTSGTIQMTVIPSFTEFLGFADPDEILPKNVSAERRRLNKRRARRGEAPVINALPRFRNRSTIAHGVVADGHTMVLGGMVAEDTVTVRKKTPVAGDIPLVGRLFRSKSEKKVRKCLLVFVTPTITDPAGNRVKGSKSVGSIPPRPAWIEADRNYRGGW